MRIQGANAEKGVLALKASAILKKVGLVEIPSNHSFYFANFFTSFEVLKALTEQEICASGTIRLKRMNKCLLKSEKEIQKQDREFYDNRFDAKDVILVMVWKDNSKFKQ